MQFLEDGVQTVAVPLRANKQDASFGRFLAQAESDAFTKL